MVMREALGADTMGRVRLLIYNIRYATGTGPAFHLPVPGAGYLRSSRQVLSRITNFIKQQDPDVVGLIEVFQGANRPANAIPGFLQYMTLMANLASRFQRNQLVGQLVGQQQLWTSLEAFARFTLDGEPEWTRSNRHTGLRHLPLRLTPAPCGPAPPVPLSS